MQIYGFPKNYRKNTEKFSGHLHSGGVDFLPLHIAVHYFEGSAVGSRYLEKSSAEAIALPILACASANTWQLVFVVVLTAACPNA